jgi:hypothetical protein
MLNNPLWAWIAATSLAVLFAHASWIKASDRELLIHHLAGYGVPVGLRKSLAYGVTVLEGLTAVTLVSPWHNWGALSAAALLGIYALAMVLQLLQKRAIDCGCGGQSLPVSWSLVGRNVLLMAWAWEASQIRGLQEWEWIDFGVVMAAVLLLMVLYSAAHQVLLQQSLLRQRLFSGSL